MFSQRTDGEIDLERLYDSDTCLSAWTPGRRQDARMLAAIQSVKPLSPAVAESLARRAEEALDIRVKAFKTVISAGGQGTRTTILLGGLGSAPQAARRGRAAERG